MKPATTALQRRNVPQSPPPRPGVTDAEELPPHSESLERAALGCVLLASETSQQEAKSLLGQLTGDLFYTPACGLLLAELRALIADGHAIDEVMVHVWLEKRAKLDQVGGNAALMKMKDGIPSLVQFRSYLDELQALAHKRWLLHVGAQIKTMAAGDGLSLTATRELLSGMLDETQARNGHHVPRIEVVTLSQIRDYVPDPKTYLVGADMICRGEFSIIAGLPEAGKSMLANSLAFAGAHGKGEWMGYEVKRQFRTFVLQSEGSMRRMHKEFAPASAKWEDWVRFTKPCHIQLGDASWRADLRKTWEQWPFDLLVIDNWSDCTTDDKFTDYQQALDNIRASLPAGDDMPAVLIVAHLTKAVIKSERPLTGRTLMAHVSGSFRIGQKARTVFTLVRAWPQENDDDTVIFDCAKANNDTPLPISAWHRKPVRFEPCKDFDFEDWFAQDDSPRTKVTVEMLETVFQGGRRLMTRKTAVDELKAMGASQPTAYRLLGKDGPFKDRLTEKDGLLCWQA